jgi:hypothetical protein
MNEQFIVPVHVVFLAVICRLPLWHNPTKINHMHQDLEFSAMILLVPNARSTDQAVGSKLRSDSEYIKLNDYTSYTKYHIATTFAPF